MATVKNVTVIKSAGETFNVRMDSDVAAWAERNAKKIYFDSNTNMLKYKNVDGTRTTLQKRIYDSFKGCNSKARQAKRGNKHVTLKDGNSMNLTRDNLQIRHPNWS